MKECTIRPAILSDLPILLAFEKGIIDFERPYDETLKPDPIHYYDLAALMDSEEAEVVVAVSEENDLVASAYIKIEAAEPYLKHSHHGYLGFMFVKPNFRGQGLNKQIIEVLKDWAIGKGIDELRLDVYDENLSAVKAYEKAGFKKQLVNMRMSISASSDA